MMNLYLKYLKEPTNRTKTLFIINKEKKTQILGDYSKIFIPEFEEKVEKFSNFKLPEAPVTGDFLLYFISKNFSNILN